MGTDADSKTATGHFFKFCKGKTYEIYDLQKETMIYKPGVWHEDTKIFINEALCSCYKILWNDCEQTWFLSISGCVKSRSRSISFLSSKWPGWDAVVMSSNHVSSENEQILLFGQRSKFFIFLTERKSGSSSIGTVFLSFPLLCKFLIYPLQKQPLRVFCKIKASDCRFDWVSDCTKGFIIRWTYLIFYQEFNHKMNLTAL